MKINKLILIPITMPVAISSVMVGSCSKQETYIKSLSSKFEVEYKPSTSSTLWKINYEYSL